MSLLLNRLSKSHKLVLLVALLIGWRLYSFNQPCHDDPVVRIPLDTFQFQFQSQSSSSSTTTNNKKNLVVAPCRVFSQDYEQARTKFRTAVQRLGLTFESLPIAVDSPNSDINSISNMDLTIDIAIIPGNLGSTEPNRTTTTSSNGLVVHLSGTHGVEGFAGSAIQVAFLEHLYQQQQQQQQQQLSSSPSESSPRPTLIFIHALNPFGMAHYRRTNENNVDLNRNGLSDEQLEELVHSHVNHVYYRQMDSFFNPTWKVTHTYAYLGIWFRAIYYIATKGYATLKRGMVGGQYYQPRGIFFGGQAPQASVRAVQGWLERYWGTHAAAPHRVTWLDVHTGLGPTGVDSLMVKPDQYCNATHELTRWFPGSNPKVEQVSQGYQDSQGFLMDYFPRELARLSAANDANEDANNNDANDDDNDSPCRILAMVQEFGTVPSVLVGHALMIENAVHYDSSLSDAAKLDWARRTTGRAFYPQSVAWRKSVLTRGLTRLLQALQRTSSSSSSSQS